MNTELSLSLQICGGVFYLLNKVFFAKKESSQSPEAQRFWRILAWLAYIIGAPAWLVILYYENKLMTFLVELGGIPSMMLGLIIAIKHGSNSTNTDWTKWIRELDRFAWSSAVAGVLVSIYSIGFMTEYTQWLELGIVFGFLVGTYRLANDHLDGYIWFLLMNTSAGVLVYVEGYPILAVQQALSLGFVLYAYNSKKRGVRISNTRQTSV